MSFLPQQRRGGRGRIEEAVTRTNLINKHTQGVDVRFLRWPVLVRVVVVQKFGTHPRMTSSADERHQGVPLVFNQEGGIQVGVQTNDGGETKVRKASATILVYENIFLWALFHHRADGLIEWPLTPFRSPCTTWSSCIYVKPSATSTSWVDAEPLPPR